MDFNSLKKKKENRFDWSDAKLLPALQSRDRATQELVWKQEKRSLELLAISILKSKADSEALVSDVFCDFFFYYVDQVRKCSSIGTYLRTMVVRRAQRQINKSLRHRSIDSDSLAVSAEPGRSKVATQVHFYKYLETCLSQISQKSQSVLRLHYIHDLSYSDIGAYLGGTKQSVGKRVLKTLQLLRDCIERQQELVQAKE